MCARAATSSENGEARRKTTQTSFRATLFGRRRKIGPRLKGEFRKRRTVLETLQCRHILLTSSNGSNGLRPWLPSADLRARCPGLVHHCQRHVRGLPRPRPSRASSLPTRRGAVTPRHGRDRVVGVGDVPVAHHHVIDRDTTLVERAAERQGVPSFLRLEHHARIRRRVRRSAPRRPARLAPALRRGRSRCWSSPSPPRAPRELGGIPRTHAHLHGVLAPPRRLEREHRGLELRVAPPAGCDASMPFISSCTLTRSEPSALLIKSSDTQDVTPIHATELTKERRSRRGWRLLSRTP